MHDLTLSSQQTNRATGDYIVLMLVCRTFKYDTLIANIVCHLHYIPPTENC